MNFFYKIVLYIGIGVLIFTLAFIGVSMYYQNTGVVFPQYISDCPDYWVKRSSGICSVVVGNGSVNALKVGYDPKLDSKVENIKVFVPSDLDKEYNPQRLTYTFDFRNSTWCNNRKWAMTNDIFWDGVTNVRSNHAIC